MWTQFSISILKRKREYNIDLHDNKQAEELFFELKLMLYLLK